MILTLVLALQTVEIEEIRTPCRYVKAGAWVPLEVILRTSAPYRGEVVAHTDARPLFIRRVDLKEAGRHRIILPVYFLSSTPRGKVYTGSEDHGVPLEGLFGVRSFDIVAAVHPDLGAPEEPRQVPGSPQRLYVQHYQGEPAEMLESVDVFASPTKEPGPGILRATGGTVASQLPHPEALAPRTFIRAGQHRPRETNGPPVSVLRRGRVILLLLAFGVAALAALFLTRQRKSGPTGTAARIAGVSLIFAGAAWAFIPENVVVVRVSRAVAVQDRTELLLYDVVSARSTTLSFELEGLAKPLFDHPCRLVLDPDRGRTRIERLQLHARTPVTFAALQEEVRDVPRVGRKGDRLQNQGDHLLQGWVIDRERPVARFEAPPRGQTRPTPLNEHVVLSPTETLILDVFYRGRRRVLGRVAEPDQLRRGEGDQFVEWRLVPRYFVLGLD